MLQRQSSAETPQFQADEAWPPEQRPGGQFGSVGADPAKPGQAFEYPSGQEQRPHERLPQTFVPDDAPLDVADDAAKIGLELAQALVGALKGVRALHSEQEGRHHQRLSVWSRDSCVRACKDQQKATLL